MEIGNITKAALTVALMMGQITPPSEGGYYEEDSNFNLVSSSLTGGWGWGLNKAHAACDAASVMECMPIHGQEQGTYTIPNPEDTFFGGMDSSSDPAGGSSGGDTTPEPTSEPTPEPTPAPTSNTDNFANLNLCNDGMEDQYKRCSRVAGYGGLLTGGFCAGLPHPIAMTACTVIVGIKLKMEMDDCDDNKTQMTRWCRDTYRTSP